jgi:hypothetical protein
VRDFRLLVPLAIIAVAVFATTALAGAFKSGHYTGTTEQGKRISFKATQGQVKKLRVTTIALCESGFGSKGVFSNLHAPIKNTRFEIKVRGNGGATRMTLRGRLTGPFAGGTIVDHTRVNPEKEGKPEPNGSDRCSATFHWAAETG